MCLPWLDETLPGTSLKTNSSDEIIPQLHDARTKGFHSYFETIAASIADRMDGSTPSREGSSSLLAETRGASWRIRPTAASPSDKMVLDPTRSRSRTPTRQFRCHSMQGKPEEIGESFNVFDSQEIARTEIEIAAPGRGPHTGHPERPQHLDRRVQRPGCLLYSTLANTMGPEPGPISPVHQDGKVLARAGDKGLYPEERYGSRFQPHPNTEFSKSN